MFWKASAPSNIALIKYVGKKDATNRPISPSLSYTLDRLFSIVQVSPISESIDRFEPLTKTKWEKITTELNKPIKTFFPFTGSPNAIRRFLKFFQFLKKTFHVSGSYLIQSGNSFPANIGAASSASSFCALTQATYQMAKKRSTQKDFVQSLSPTDLSTLSRQGSGSSCRSFFRPWALWKDQYAELVQLPFPRLIHHLVIINSQQKKVSSSIAHECVRTSPLFQDRINRARQRLSDLLIALKNKNWKQCFQISFDEFQDLHQLYETASPPIYYKEKASDQIIQTVQELWKKKQDGPLITMDAGSAVHLLYRPDQKQIAQELFSQLSQKFDILR